jgi:hypothetical protein
MSRPLAAVTSAAAALCLSCSDGRSYEQAVGILIDVSGTYADERVNTVRVIKREVLPHIVPGDTLLVARIDSESYDHENVEALLTLDRRPSHANAQKLELARRLDAFALREFRAPNTDIQGAIMLASEYLNETGAGSRVLLIFSDLEEDLPAGDVRRLEPAELAGTRVVALNVKHLGHDQANPQAFRERLASWQKVLGAAGAAEWKTLMDPARLAPYLEEVRGG